MIGIVTFADRRYYKSLTRFYRQACNIKVFDFVSVNTEENLPRDYVVRNHLIPPPTSGSSWLNNLRWTPSRGFGYWCWKPYVVLQQLERYPSIKILFYCDAGTHIQESGRDRLLEYIEILTASPYNILAFQFTQITPYIKNIFDGWVPETTYGYTSENLFESCWTKGDMFDAFCIKEDHPYAQSPQNGGGLFAVKNNVEIRSFLRKWIQDTENKPHLFNDDPSILPNFRGFIENRHDQSYLSLSAKIMGYEMISEYEAWCPYIDLPEKTRKLLSNMPFDHRRDINKKYWKLSNAWQRIMGRTVA